MVTERERERYSTECVTYKQDRWWQCIVLPFCCSLWAVWLITILLERTFPLFTWLQKREALGLTKNSLSDDSPQLAVVLDKQPLYASCASCDPFTILRYWKLYCSVPGERLTAESKRFVESQGSPDRKDVRPEICVNIYRLQAQPEKFWDNYPQALELHSPRRQQCLTSISNIISWRMSSIITHPPGSETSRSNVANGSMLSVSFRTTHVRQKSARFSEQATASCHAYSWARNAELWAAVALHSWSRIAFSHRLQTLWNLHHVYFPYIIRYFTFTED